MNAAAVSAPEIAACTHYNRFEKLLVVAGVVPRCQDRCVRIRNVVYERASAGITSLNSDIAVSKNIGKFQIRGPAVAGRRYLSTKPDFLGLNARRTSEPDR